MRNPPVFVAILGFFSALAGFAYLFFGLRVVGFDWFGAFGDIPAFEHVGLWGWLAIATGAIWILVAVGLWSLQTWARLFALFMAGFALLEVVIAFFQFPGTGIGLAMGIMPGLIIWYLSTGEVKSVFAEAADPAPSRAPEPAAAPMAFAAPLTPAPAAAVAAPAVVAAAVAAVSPSPVTAAPPPVAAAVAAEATPDAPPAPHHLPIVDVEGIGPVYADKLAAIGIMTTTDLLEAGAKPYARERIAEQTGISSSLIREWVDNVDLMRVPGVGPQYSDLLEAAGVGSPAELAHRNAANLAITLQEVVAERPAVVRRIPSEAEVAAWIDEASRLESQVEH